MAFFNSPFVGAPVAMWGSPFMGANTRVGTLRMRKSEASSGSSSTFTL